MKTWHLFAVLIVGYLVGSYYGFARLKALLGSVTTAAQ
jgi:hypothetical protein